MSNEKSTFALRVYSVTLSTKALRFGPVRKGLDIMNSCQVCLYCVVAVLAVTSHNSVTEVSSSIQAK